MKPVVAVAVCMLVAAAPAAAKRTPAPTAPAVPEQCNIKYGGFGQSVAFIEAQARGFFAEQGLNVCYTQVGGSMPQFAALYAGTYDIISTTTDNSINRFVNRGDRVNGTVAPPVQIVSAASQGPQLALWSVESVIPTLADVAGKTISVDAPTSGLVFTLRQLLAVKANLTVPAYSFSDPAGGTGQRLERLSNGTANATMLYSPFSDDASTRPGLKNLGLVSSVIPQLQLDGLTTLRSYGTQEPGATLLPRFLAALIKGSRYARKRGNRKQIVADIAKVYPVKPEAFLNAILDPATGENVDLQMNFEGLKAAIDLRKQFGGFGTLAPTVNSSALVQPAADGLFNDAYLKEALKIVKFTKRGRDHGQGQGGVRTQRPHRGRSPRHGHGH